MIRKEGCGMKIHPRCVYCLKVQKKWHLLRSNTLVCEETGQEVSADSACEEFALDSTRMLEWAHYRNMVPGSGVNCVFCRNYFCLNPTESPKCRLLPIPYGSKGDHVCDFCDPI